MSIKAFLYYRKWLTQSFDRWRAYAVVTAVSTVFFLGFWTYFRIERGLTDIGGAIALIALATTVGGSGLIWTMRFGYLVGSWRALETFEAEFQRGKTREVWEAMNRRYLTFHPLLINSRRFGDLMNGVAKAVLARGLVTTADEKRAITELLQAAGNGPGQMASDANRSFARYYRPIIVVWLVSSSLFYATKLIELFLK